MEPVFRSMEIATGVVMRLTGTAITFDGLHNIPATGGAVVAINHTSYVDFLPAAWAATQRKRRLRFMVKAELQQVRVIDFLIRTAKAIPVDRSAGAGAYYAAIQSLRAGELLAVYPEATISRSFELKEFKSGAARMSVDAGVPVIPLIVWGAQRVWTKDHPKHLGRNKFPISVRVGTPLLPTGTADTLEVRLRSVMAQLLDEVQADYPHPPGAYWVPRRLGGSAPTPEQATTLDAAELAERARRQAES